MAWKTVDEMTLDGTMAETPSPLGGWGGVGVALDDPGGRPGRDPSVTELLASDEDDEDEGFADDDYDDEEEDYEDPDFFDDEEDEDDDEEEDDDDDL
ncbi:MAG: hypothetical protein AAGK04_05490 [Planctomycetota bacterium]